MVLTLMLTGKHKRKHILILQQRNGHFATKRTINKYCQIKIIMFSIIQIIIQYILDYIQKIHYIYKYLKMF